MGLSNTQTLKEQETAENYSTTEATTEAKVAIDGTESMVRTHKNTK